ncbi:MAG: methyltransferase domain-containing protein [Chitinophagaceae bacterium]|nr:methyltransferase domain-containing protein [Chitinophagaceae bacterium]
MKTEIRDIKEYYDKNVIGKLKGFVYGNPRVERAWQEVNNWIMSPPKQILEIGCGIGDISYRISQKFPEATVVGFDVSERSINIANQIFQSPNLRFVLADDISLIKGSEAKYDIIYMIDVFEHIPVEVRSNLYAYVKNNLKEDGFVFFSCPTVAHQEFLRKNNPGGLQPIDEDITIETVLEFSNQTQVPLVFYKEVSVWNKGDYLHAVLAKRKYAPFSDKVIPRQKTIKRLLYEKYLKVDKHLDQKEVNDRLRLIREKVGEEVYSSVKS